MEAYEKLVKWGNEASRDLQSKLVSSVPKKMVLAVKTHYSRDNVKEIIDTKRVDVFLASIGSITIENSLKKLHNAFSRQGRFLPSKYLFGRCH